MTLLLLSCGLSMSAQAPLCSAGETGGRVWRDFNNDGFLDTEETSGVAGVVVTAYDNDGAVETTTSDNFGYYVFTTLTFPNSYRVEFSALPAPYAATFQNSGESNEVQFVEAASCEVNFGVNDPTDYCQEDPYIVTACYVGGDNSGNGDVLVGIPYNQVGDVAHYAVENEIGSTWGLAYKKSSKELFSAAVVKRHTGLGPNGIGAIYRTNITGGGSNLHYDFGALAGTIGTNAARGLTTPGAASYDTEAFYKVGKAGLGDLDISTDGNTLWVVNLNDGGLYSMAADAPAPNSAVAAPPIPDLACPITVPTITNQLIDCGAIAANAAAGYLPCTGLYGTDDTLALAFDSVLMITGDEYPYMRFGRTATLANPPTSNTTSFADEALVRGNFVVASTPRPFHYRIPVPDGTYRVDLGFNASSGNLAATEFDVTLEDIKVLTAYKPAVADIPEEQTFTTTVSDGILNIMFVNTAGRVALVNAIRITQLTDAGTPPVSTQRPWGMKVYNDGTGDKIYVGVVCSAEESGRDQDLQANVMVYDPATTSWSGPVLSFSLNYAREEATLNDKANWLPWSDSYQNLQRNLNSFSLGDGGTPFPQPIISDIEFEDNGDMILGILDRGGLQMGFNNSPPEAPYGPGGSTLTTLVSAGDVLRAGKNDNNSWTIENDGQVTNAITGVTNGGGTASPAGPGGREFYFGENYSAAGHQESSFGGLSIFRSANEIIHTALDASRTQQNAGGIQWLNNTDGSFSFGVDVYDENTVGAFAKAVGLGDVELLCIPAPQQIGNYVWNDIDRDGVADPLEDPIAGVTVALYVNVGGTLVYLANTTTDASGEYAFTGIGTPGENWVATSGIDSIQPLTNYVLVFGYDGTTPQFVNNELVVAGQNYFLTMTDTGNGTTPDQNDNDAAVSTIPAGSFPTISLTTGLAGISNPRFDAGFFACPMITGPTATQSICEDEVGDPVSVETNQNAPNSIRFVRFSADQTVTNGSETATELAIIYAGGMSLDTVTPTGVDDPFTATLTTSIGGWEPGTYYVYAILTSDAGPTCRPLQEIIITVTDRPDISANDLTVCETMPGSGATVDLVALVQNPDGATLAFAEGDTPIGTPTAAVLAAGTHTITTTATNTLAGCDSVLNFMVTVQDFPAAQSYCPVESITLTAPAGATSVVWYRDGMIVGGGLTYMVTMPGSYTYTAENGDGCFTESCCPEIFTSSNCAPVTVGDTTFVDMDGDGLQSPGDLPLEGVTVMIYDNATMMLVSLDADGSPYPSTQITGPDGSYLFENLPPGDYYVSFDISTTDNSEFYDFITPNGGDDALDSDAMPPTPTADTGNSAPTGPLISGQSDLTLDAGVSCVIQVEVADPFTICSSQKIELNQGASIIPASLDGLWSSPDGTGVFDSGNLFSSATTYTPSSEDVSRGSVTLVLTTNDLIGPCLPVSNTITIQILKVDCGAFFWDGKKR